MVFSSITFLFYFLPIVLALYYLVPNKYKNIVNEKNLTYSSATEIILTYKNPEENVTVNRIARYQFNKKRIMYNPKKI